MPELPDITVYVECLSRRIVGSRLLGVRLISSFVLRTFDPPIDSCEGFRVRRVRRLGKRIVIELDDERFLVIHLMIAGRLQWKDDESKAARAARNELARLTFERGVLILTEASTKKRASIHAVQGEVDLLAGHDAQGLDVSCCDVDVFASRLRQRNRTLKRALTDPGTIDGVGNAYSDEILHAARLSPILLTSRLTNDDAARLLDAARRVLNVWTDRLRGEAGERWPTKVTAFRPEMNVHGKFGQPCPFCGAKVQRIVRGDHETNYCPGCQTGGKVLKDRSLSRLLRDDWPGDMDDWE